MKLAIAVVCTLVACGKGENKDGAKPGSGSAGGAVKAEAPAKKGATGSVTTSGALDGTWDWKDDLALDCAWIPNLSAGSISLTMADGTGGFMALEGHFGKERTDVSFTSGKLKSPSPFKQAAGGVVISGTGNTGGDAPVTVTAQFDAVTTRGDETIKIKGTLTARCN